jgi:hypothetical protein
MAFLDVLARKKSNSSLGHSLYMKTTYTDLYLHAESEHHLTHKMDVLSTLDHLARTICDTESLDKDIQHLKRTFKHNGYSDEDINQALKAKNNQQTETKTAADTASLPFQYTSHKISRLLAKHIRMSHMPRKKTIHTLRLFKDSLGLKIPGVYCIPCNCTMVYIAQTNRGIEIRRKEHMRHPRLGQPDISAVAEYILEMGHCMKFSETHRLVRTEGYMDYLVKEAIKIIHPNNFNRDGGFILRWAAQPILKQLRTATSNK